MADKTDFGPRLGADPELFVADVTSNKIVPVCGKVGGTKAVPLKIDSGLAMDKYTRPYLKGSIGEFAVQEDNVMFEFNMPALLSADAFVRTITGLMSNFLPHFLAERNLVIKYSNTHRFHKDVLDATPQALQIGCLPDFDAYRPNGRFEREPLTAQSLNQLRFCGGHLHVQYNKNNVPPHIFAQFMDVVVSLAFLKYDQQKERRKFYGMPGIFREKTYGIEYRTPSNFWLKPAFVQLNLWHLTENIFALAALANSDSPLLKAAYKRIPWADVQAAIKEEDTKASTDILAFLRQSTGLPIQVGEGAAT